MSDRAEALPLAAPVPLAGVLHAAGALYDAMLRSMSTGHFDASFAPKALGASGLWATVARTPLEAFGLFSSVASTFGNVGQANYAAANAYLDALARCRRRVGTPSSSLQIPAVRGSGMGAATFSAEQLDAIGAVSLSYFALCLAASLAPARSTMQATLAPLAPALVCLLYTSPSPRDNSGSRMPSSA